MKGRKLIPKSRFSEFLEERPWITEELSELASPVKEKAGTADDDDVLTLSSEEGLVKQTEYFGRQLGDKNTDRYIKVKKGDFVYNDRKTSVSEFGTIRALEKYESGCVSPIYKCFRFQNPDSCLFWRYYFESKTHESELAEFVNEGARQGRFNISIDKFLGISVVAPAPAEQQKIADCLESLDRVIAAHRAKLDALRDHKKGLLQQLFPAEGETTPKLRFPEFEGEWVERRGVHLFEDRKDKGSSNLPIYSVTQDKGLVPRNTLERKQDDLAQASDHKRVDGGWLCYNTMRMWQGAVGYADENCMVSPAYVVIAPKQKVSSRFFLYYFKTQTGLRKLESYSRGLTRDRLRLYFEDFSAIPFLVPKTYDEQVRIAEILKQAEANIWVYHSILEQLEAHKKGLMQQLFPRVE